MKLDHYLTLYTKLNSQWIKDIDVRPGTIKILEEHISIKSFDISVHIFWICFLRQGQQKQKKRQTGLHHLKSFCKTKETIKKMKRQPTEQEKIFTSDLSDKVYYPKFIKNSQLNM